MARPIKQGLDYFPMDVHFQKDLKVRKVLRACGSSATSVLLSLLGNIYGDNGYYMQWDEDVRFLISDEVGVNEGHVQEVVNKSVQVGLFNKEKFNQFEILTSKGIQERFLSASLRKTKIVIDCNYLVFDYKNIEKANINFINVGRSTQRKVKESKEKKIPPNPPDGGTVSFDFKKELLDYLGNKQLAEDWMKVRIKKKASNTQTSFQGLLREVEKSGKTPQECIRIAVERDWKGFRAEWITEASNPKDTSAGKQFTAKPERGFHNSEVTQYDNKL